MYFPWKYIGKIIPKQDGVMNNLDVCQKFARAYNP